MTRALILAAAACAIALGGCNNLNDPLSGPFADMTPEERTAYVDAAAASDLFEIQSSNLALSRSQNANVRQFAQMMISHHSQSTDQLRASARASGVTPVPRLTPMQTKMMNQLQVASPGTFDRIYMTQQVRAHELALALHSNYARAGDAPALRATASAAVPVVTQHLAQARQLAR